MESPYTILLVDDDEDIIEFLSYNLKKEGYFVHTATNGKDAIRKANMITPNLIVLDIMMPGMDGFTTCKILRKNKLLNECMIAFLTAKGDDFSQINSFEAGGDDYIQKPIQPKVFVSRIKAILRRQRSTYEEYTSPIQAGNVIIDKEKHYVEINGKEIYLPKKEFDMLVLLASNADKVLSREEIYREIWGESVIVGNRTIDVHIRKLREIIDIPNIKTIKGIGYKFEIL